MPTIRWLKDGKHYLLSNDPTKRTVPRLQKVNAATGEATAFLDSAKMENAFNALGGITTADAKQLANRGCLISSDWTALFSSTSPNDIFYYDAAATIGARYQSAEEEVGEHSVPMAA